MAEPGPVRIANLPRPPEAVLFDVGDTLVRPEPSWSEVYRAACIAYGLDISEEGLRAALLAEIEGGALDELGPFEIGSEASFARIKAFDAGIMARLGLELPDEFYRQVGLTFARRESWHVFADVVPTLDRLRAVGIRRAIVSNWLWEAPELLARLGLADDLDAVVISDRVGYNKPHPQIFREALAALGATADRTIHVGDSYRNDVGGARAAGIAPVLIVRDRQDGQRPPSMPPNDPVPVIGGLDELLVAIGLEGPGVANGD